ncbi:MAG: glycogen/starch synthase, partial [Alphaproteobacteria bacterium]|nr:glycogen/starch synthase [Alphaproteobacteria bacterium]
MKVLFVTSEVYPLVKTGGLGDVANSLPKALHKAGVDVRIVLPSYKHINAQIRNKRPAKYIGQHFGFGDCHLVLGEMPDSDVPVWLINCPEAFERHGVGPYESSYGADWGDNYRRFALLSKVAEIISYGEIDNWKPDAVHCQDWQCGLTPVYIKYANMENKPKTVFTIHNLKYMGCFGNHVPYEVGINPEVNGIEGAELYGRFSYLKAGIVYSDVTTTVS